MTSVNVPPNGGKNKSLTVPRNIEDLFCYLTNAIIAGEAIGDVLSDGLDEVTVNRGRTEDLVDLQYKFASLRWLLFEIKRAIDELYPSWEIDRVERRAALEAHLSQRRDELQHQAKGRAAA